MLKTAGGDGGRKGGSCGGEAGGGGGEGGRGLVVRVVETDGVWVLQVVMKV